MNIPPKTSRVPVLALDLTGRTVIVIGANIGLGFEASKHFATMKPERLILGCRDQTKGQAALEKIQAETGYSKALVWPIDLSNFASVSAFADKVDSELDRLDIIVQNAGMTKFAYEKTADGWETMLQVNYISQALLAIRLLPILAKTAKLLNTVAPRLVLVTSTTARDVTWTEAVVKSPAGFLKTLNKSDYLTDEKIGLVRYFETKLLEMLLTRSLHIHVSAPSPIVNCVCPGFCVSELRRSLPLPLKEMTVKMEETSAYTTEEGSRQLVFAAIGETESAGADGMRGAFAENDTVSSYGDFVASETGQAAERIAWEETLDILEGVDAKIKDIRGAYIK